MAIRIRGLENDQRQIIARLGKFSVLEYMRDPSVAPSNAAEKYFMGEMGVRQRQVLVNLDGSGAVVVQAGAMQWMAGNVKLTTGVKGVGDLLGKVVKSSITKETAIKPEYVGVGTVALEPTYKYIILQNVGEWGPGGMVIEDGMFLACDGAVEQRIAVRNTLSSAVLGNEGLFNLCLRGNGIAALESNIPLSEVIEIDLENDVLKIDGSYAIAWSGSLEFTVERSSATLVGSMVNSEGLVNVYRGTGKVLMSAIVQNTSSLATTTHSK